jgi:hypothetical protein
MHSSVKLFTMLQCYERQFTVWACSVASITILLNTWFSLYGHQTKQTQQQVLDISGQAWWTRAVTTRCLSRRVTRSCTNRVSSVRVSRDCVYGTYGFMFPTKHSTISRYA